MVENVNYMAYVAVSYAIVIFTLCFLIVLTLFQKREARKHLKKVESDLD